MQQAVAYAPAHKVRAIDFVVGHSPKFGRQFVRSISVADLDLQQCSELMVRQDKYLPADDAVFAANVSYLLSTWETRKIFDFPDLVVAILRHSQKSAAQLVDHPKFIVCFEDLVRDRTTQNYKLLLIVHLTCMRARQYVQVCSKVARFQYAQVQTAEIEEISAYLQKFSQLYPLEPLSAVNKGYVYVYKTKDEIRLCSPLVQSIAKLRDFNEEKTRELLEVINHG